MTRTLAMVVEYDGTDWHGWQRQPGVRTVQGAIEEALGQMIGTSVRVQGAARTDAGVHARGQVASVVLERGNVDIPVDGIRKGLNTLLPKDVAVTAVREVPAAFDARRSALGKRYRYLVWNAPDRSPLHARLSWYQRRPLDLEPMRDAARLLEGEHDFAAFRAADCDRKTSVRRLSRVEISRSEQEPALVAIVVEGNAFLKNMVRILAGTLVEVAQGRRSLPEVRAALDGGRREQAGVTAPPQGLCLEKVFYPLFPAAGEGTEGTEGAFPARAAAPAGD